MGRIEVVVAGWETPTAYKRIYQGVDNFEVERQGDIIGLGLT